MRGVALTLLTTCAFACAQPPEADSGPATLESRTESRPASGDERPATAPTDPTAPAIAGAPELDPTLATLRTQVRGGRISDERRRALLDSRDPDHRHAARLLQAIAGEVPAPVLARHEGGGRPDAVAALDPVDPVAPELGPTPQPARQPEPKPEPKPEQPEPKPAAAVDERDSLRFDVLPKLDGLPPDSPARAWFAGAVVVEDPPEPLATLEFTPTDAELPLLLREPVFVTAPPARGGAGGMVILTRLDLRDTSEGEVVLELAGAGAVAVAAQPLSPAGDRLRVWIADAGAVPAFVSARPSVDQVAVVDVVRRDRWLWIDLELAPGWAVRMVTTLDNGASLAFADAR